MKHGGCNIHMDGASYHKRIINKCPTKSWRKASIVDWIIGTYTSAVFSPKATITNLLELVDIDREEPKYMATEIACKYGHLVYFTPPYHPTLQPIELIWGMVKGGIARPPVKNAADLVKRVLAGPQAHKDRWVSVFRHAQGHEDSFIEIAKQKAASD